MLGETTFGITGATGAIGGRVASRLAVMGHAQRLIVRAAASAPDLLAQKSPKLDTKIRQRYDVLCPT